MATLTVLPLENMSDSTGATRTVDDMLAASLDNAARFRRVAREAADEKMGTEATPQIDRLAAREVGRRLGVDGVLYGTITEYGALSKTPPGNQGSVFGLQLRLMDVRTGIIVWSALINRTSEKSLFGKSLSASELALASTREVMAELTLGASAGIDSGDGSE